MPLLSQAINYAAERSSLVALPLSTALANALSSHTSSGCSSFAMYLISLTAASWPGLRTVYKIKICRAWTGGQRQCKEQGESQHNFCWPVTVVDMIDRTGKDPPNSFYTKTLHSHPRGSSRTK